MDAVTTTTTTETPEIKLHFLDYWRVIRLRKSLILTVFLLCVISSSVLTYWLPKQYSSTARIEVQKDAPEVALTVPGQVNPGWDPYFLTTQFRIITSWGILCQVITNLNLTHVLASQVDEPDWSLDQTYAFLSRKVAVDQTRGTSLIEISVRNSNPDIAATIANKVADTYKQYRLDLWQSTRQGGIDALESQLAVKQAALTNLLADLDDLREQLQIPELNDTGPMVNATIYSETIRALEMRRIDAQMEYNDDNSLLANLRGLRTNNLLPEALATAFRGQLDQDLFYKSQEVSRAKQTLSDVREQGYGANHPLSVSALKALEEATNAYAVKIEGILAGLEGRVEKDQRLLETIVKEEDKAKANSNAEAKRDRAYFIKKRNAENITRAVEDLQRRLMDEMVEAKQPLRNTVVVHDPARPDKHPVSPKPMYIIPCGILLGLFVGIGLAFFIEYLDTSVKTIDDVERSLQAPVLGVIPQNVGNVMDEGPESPHAEAYRVLRTNLLFSRKDDSWNTLTVLSGGAGEGKTTTLFNLATVFAQNGQRVLLVDSDLRRPGLHRMLRANNTSGLTDLLLNKQIAIDQVIQKTKLPTMDFIPSGKLPSSSMSILGSTQMKDVIRELKRRYEFIFFDSPPLLGVSDASILASEMDMVLQVIQYRRYPQPMTLRAKQMIQKVGGNLLGLVLNNINMSQDENYYYYSGYYEYEYRSPKSEPPGGGGSPTVVQLSDAAKEAKIEIKQKY
jgi:capsular exopolysaccharide synthesis family protein